METINNTSFQNTWIYGKGPALKDYIVVVVKGTFDLLHNHVCVQAQNQLPIFLTDQHYADPETSSTKIESDYVTFKPKTDVILLGKGYAPNEGPTDTFDVSVSINGNEESIRVTGNRHWVEEGNTLVPSEINDIYSIDLKFENAFGGKDPLADQEQENPLPFYKKNPVGKGYYVTGDHAKGKPLPNLEDPNDLIREWSDKPEPKCFGWYGKSWTPRIEKAKNVESTAPNLPLDFDWEFNNGASTDLILHPYLNGNEVIELTNCEIAGKFKFYLPGITPLVRFDFGSGEEEVPMHLDTLCIIMQSEIETLNTEIHQIEKQAYMVWRGKMREDELHRLDALKRILID